MGVDIVGTTLTTSSGLAANASVGQVMKMGTTGILQRYFPGQPMFRAGGTSGTWVTLTSAAWNAIILPNTNVNTGSCYNTGNGRFTVPVGGVYLVTAHTYILGAAAGWYFHPMFWVNGVSNASRPNSAGAGYRIRLHGATAGYQSDSEIAEIILLVAGDYVQFYNFSNAANQYLPQYSRFEGYLLG